MKRVVPFAVALLLLGASVARADIPPIDPHRPPRTPPAQPTPQPEPKPTSPNPEVASTGCGLGITASVVLAGVWLLRPRRRPALQS